MDTYPGHVRPATQQFRAQAAPRQMEGDWTMTEYCNLPPSICQCHLCTFQLPRVRSEASSVDRPSKSRRLRYLMDDAPPIWEQSHDQRSAYGTTSLRGLPSTPPSSQGSQRSSKDTHRINSSRSQGPIPRPNRQPEPVGAHRLPSSRGLIMEAGSWCEDRPERHQDMVDDFLLYDEDINARRGMPHCPSPLGRRLATPELAPLCTDFEFCSCCNYDRIACSDRSSRRRAKLDAQVDEAMSYIAGVRSRHRHDRAGALI